MEHILWWFYWIAMFSNLLHLYRGSHNVCIAVDQTVFSSYWFYGRRALLTDYSSLELNAAIPKSQTIKIRFNIPHQAEWNPTASVLKCLNISIQTLLEKLAAKF